MKHLFLLFAMLTSLGAFAQDVSSSMTLSGSGGTAVGRISPFGMSGSSTVGSLSVPLHELATLPTEIATALEEADAQDVRVTVSSGRVAVEALGPFVCYVYDASGRVVAMQRATASVGIELEAGLYVVAVLRDDKVVSANKYFVK